MVLSNFIRWAIHSSARDQNSLWGSSLLAASMQILAVILQQNPASTRLDMFFWWFWITDLGVLGCTFPKVFPSGSKCCREYFALRYFWKSWLLGQLQSAAEQCERLVFPCVGGNPGRKRSVKCGTQSEVWHCKMQNPRESIHKSEFRLWVREKYFTIHSLHFGQSA